MRQATWNSRRLGALVATQAMLFACGGSGSHGVPRDVATSNETVAETVASDESVAETEVSGDGAEVDGGPELPSFSYAKACQVGQAAPSSTSIVAVDAFPELSDFAAPLQLVHAGDGSGRVFVVERQGRIIEVSGPPGAHTTTTFLDIGAKVYTNVECGFLGAAFHPDFANDGRVFVTYCVRQGDRTFSLLTRFELDPSRTVLDPTSEVELLEVEQPFDNHDGGSMAFGPDGLLYYGFGDGGSGNDPGNRAQNSDTLLGKFLRLDVDHADGGQEYAIPPGNVFADGQGGRAEICALGLRNPWRASFDRLTGELWVGDVGQGRWEEVDIVRCGKNYGWKVMEGAHCRPGGPADCDTTGFELPLFEYPHSGGALNGNSVTGGFVYRGTRVPSLWGRYVFADYGAGWVATWARGEPAPSAPLLLLSGIAGFGEDELGEIYLLSISTGRIHVLEGRSDVAANARPPLTLGATGCFDLSSAGPLAPSTGVLPYDLVVPFWSDGADKQRFIVLPDGGKVDFAEAGKWQLPTSTVLIEHFVRDDPLGGPPVRIETRFLVKEPNGLRGFAYRWRKDQTDADLVVDGAVVELPLGPAETFDWAIPTAGQCRTCHRDDNGSGGDGLLGLETRQLNREVAYGGGTFNQIGAWRAWGLFTGPVPDPASLPSHAPISGTAPVAERARTWLDVNCSFCHQPGGPSDTALDLRLGTDLSDASLCDAMPQHGDLGLLDARLLRPGDSATSVLHARIATRGEGAMPPLASALVDTLGAALIAQWIDGLATCP